MLHVYIETDLKACIPSLSFQTMSIAPKIWMQFGKFINYSYVLEAKQISSIQTINIFLLVFAFIFVPSFMFYLNFNSKLKIYLEFNLELNLR